MLSFGTHLGFDSSSEDSSLLKHKQILLECVVLEGFSNLRSTLISFQSLTFNCDNGLSTCVDDLVKNLFVLLLLKRTRVMSKLGVFN